MKRSHKPGRRGRRVAALTLIELLVVLAILGTLTVAIGYAFVAGFDLQRAQARRSAQSDEIEQMDRRLKTLIQGARLSDDDTDTGTYFVGESTDGDTELGAQTLTFTTIAPGIPLAAQESTDDFEAQHDRFGPVGGVAEVSLSTTAFGDAGDKTGLFERVQRPSDEDRTQGGDESLLAKSVERIGFEFFNGTEWGTQWDTVNGAERRLPAAVRVKYTLKDDDSQSVRTLTIAIPTSDVTPANVSQNGTTP